MEHTTVTEAVERRGIFATFPLVFVVALILSLFIFKGNQLPVISADEKTHKLTGITYETDNIIGEITLPATLKNLPPRTPVTLYAQIPPGQSNLLVKSKFTPMKLYLNDTLVYEFGQEGSYPGFMNDPPTGLAIIPVPLNTESVSLRLEYLSPSQKSEISIPAIYTGDEISLITMMFRAKGVSLLFSFILIFVGLTMSIIALAFVRKITGGISLLWLGMFSLAAGIWVLGACDLSAFIIPYPSLLYAMAYIGLFCATPSFLKFGLIILNPKNKLPVKIMIYIHLVSIAAALLLQFTGVVDFIKILYWFHIIASLGFVVLTADLLWEFFRNCNKAARWFSAAVVLLAASVVLEVLNYWLKLIGSFTTMFQLGLMAFIILLGVESGRYIREAMNAAAEKLRLEYEVKAAKEREQRLASENASLDRMNTLKTELMENISHEAHTPLAVLSSYAGLVSMELKDKGVDAQTAADLDKIVFEATRVANLIDSMKKLTLHGAESTKRVRLDISEAVRQTVELYRHILERRGISLILMADENVPPVFGSAEELTQVLFNLLQNAKSHIEKGAVIVNVKSGSDSITVTVADTGEGISPRLLPYVFERGVSGAGGSGIGLALCKEIIETHGGTIVIESEEEKGTVVTFTLPEYKEAEKDGE